MLKDHMVGDKVVGLHLRLEAEGEKGCGYGQNKFLHGKCIFTIITVFSKFVIQKRVVVSYLAIFVRDNSHSRE